MPFRLTGVVKHLIFLNIIMFLGTMLMGEVFFRSVDGDIMSVAGKMMQWDGQNIFIDGEQVQEYLLGRYSLAVYYPGSVNFQPFQLVTHMFMHFDIFHILMNMLGLFFFGPRLEMLWGEKRFLFLSPTLFETYIIAFRIGRHHRKRFGRRGRRRS